MGKNLCGEFTERMLKSREWKWKISKAVGYRLGKLLPLDFHTFPSTKLTDIDRVQGKRERARCATQRNLRKTSATKSKLDLLNIWGLGK